MTHSRSQNGGGTIALWGVAAVCIVIELFLTATDYGIFGPVGTRFQVFIFGAFWQGLLGEWLPRYPGQPALMFVTHAFLHANIIHLVANMASLIAIGRTVVVAVGQARFLVAYLATAVGGGIGFALLGDSSGPLVGASGAIFGLVGLLLGWEITIARSNKTSLGPALRVVGVLILLNVVLFWATKGQLAWQAHLGGTIVGVLLSPVIRQRG